MSRLSLMSGSALVACVATISGPAGAETAREFNIPAGPMGEALTLFATQADQQIFYSGDLVAGIRTAGLRGRYAPSRALDALLAGTGLSWAQTRPGVVFLRREGGAAQRTEAATELDAVIVTGSLLKSSGGLASPVVVIDREALDRRGFGTVAETLTDLPQNYSGSATPIVQTTGADRQGSNAVIATGVNLRGLGPASTLVLINGRRVAGTGFRGEFGDVSALPSGAVERVDVLLDGASALYGADAVAGVVNVIMRRAFDGQESRLRVSAARGGAEDLILSHLAGRAWSSGSAYLSYEYQTTNSLSSLDRPYTADGDLRPFGGTDHRTMFSAPGNILVFSAGQGGYVPQYGIQPNASGSAQGPADFAIGSPNLQATALGADLLPNLERHSLYGRVRQSMGDRLDLTADVRFNRRSYDFASTAPISIFPVTQANPFFASPNGAPLHLIAYSFQRDLGASLQKGVSKSLGITSGAIYDFGKGWSLDGYVAYAEERGDSGGYKRVNSRFLNEALGSAPDDPATAYRAAVDGYFNPFGAGAANGRTVLDFISSGYSRSTDRSRATSANLLLSGPVATLPGGEVQLAVGAQVRRETFDTRTMAFLSTAAPVEMVTPQAERTIRSVFAETRIPLIGPGNVRPGLRGLEASVAVRLEDYDDFGTTTNPKLGLVWSPAQDLAFRASWGTSFRAASLPQINDAAVTSVSTFVQAGGANVLSLYLTGGNPELKPETAETFTVGFDHGSREGLSFSANLFHTEFTDRIAQPATENLAGVLSDPALSPFVMRISPGASAADLALVQTYTRRPDFAFGALYPETSYGAIIDGRWVNTGRVRVRGFDLSGQYPFQFGAGTITLDGSASYILDYESQVTPTAVVRNVVDLIGYPVRLRSRVGASWSQGDFGGSLHWSHVADYKDRLGAVIKAWNTLDGQASWTPSGERLGGLRVALTIQNLLDEDPPFHDGSSGFGFDPGQSSLLGRTVALQLIKRW